MVSGQWVVGGHHNVATEEESLDLLRISREGLQESTQEESVSN